MFPFHAMVSVSVLYLRISNNHCRNQFPLTYVPFEAFLKIIALFICLHMYSYIDNKMSKVRIIRGINGII